VPLGIAGELLGSRDEMLGSPRLRTGFLLHGDLSRMDEIFPDCNLSFAVHSAEGLGIVLSASGEMH
jgi:hypothetical protein